jgi:hypothetical protein
MEDHETRRKIIRQWMALPKDKGQSADQAAAFAKGPSSRTSFSAVAASRTTESWDGCCLASAGRDGPPGRSDPSDLVSWRGALILSGTTSALGAVEIISIDAIPATWSALSPLVLSVIACPQRNQAISRSDSNIDVPLARRVRAEHRMVIGFGSPCTESRWTMVIKKRREIFEPASTKEKPPGGRTRRLKPSAGDAASGRPRLINHGGSF